MKKTLSLFLLLPLMIGCGNESGPVEVTEVRESGGGAGPTPTGMSTAQRLGMGAGAAPAASAGSEYTWDTPEGWSEGPTSQFRQVADFTIASSDALDCYVSKAGGGVEANVNRWRGQMGLEPLDAAGIAALPRIEVAGESAVYMDIEGTFSGMGPMAGQPQENTRMLGVILPQTPQALFIKMTGPKEAVAAEKANFEAFCASLEEGAAAPADPHAGMDMSGAMPSAADEPAYHWTVPEGWTEVDTNSPMRMATLTVGDAELSLFKFGGTGGGLEGNIGMWLQQMGHDPTADMDAAQQQPMEMLGTEATLVRITGDYEGKAGQSGEDYTMLSVYCPVDDGTVFVKFVGPTSQVAAQEAGFRQFCASLHSAQH